MKMKLFHSARAIVGSFSLAACALMPSLSLLRNNIQPDLSFIGNDGISLFEKRFDRVKGEIPASGTIYYASGPSSDDVMYFFLTQYVLAPIIVTRTSGPQTLIYILPTIREPLDSSADAEVSRQKFADGAEILDFHNGIKLARGRPQ